jgi:hypothetical protein
MIFKQDGRKVWTTIAERVLPMSSCWWSCRSSGLLVAMLMPAIGAARNAARKAGCQNNLRQIGLAMAAHAQQTSHDALCTGAFDWKHDGAVTEVGWVADLVRREVLVGEMLCSGNPAQISETYEDLLNLDASAAGLQQCIKRLGNPGYAGAGRHLDRQSVPSDRTRTD